MPEWTIRTNLAAPGSTPDRITAEYLKVTDDGRFIEFKDSSHKVVYMVSSNHVVSVARVVDADPLEAPRVPWWMNRAIRVTGKESAPEVHARRGGEGWHRQTDNTARTR